MPSLNTGNAILSNAIAVDSSYNVGIGGAASGSFKLQVTGTSNLTGALTGTSATFSSSVKVASSSTGGLFEMGSGANANSRSFRLASDVNDWGDFGIQVSNSQTGTTYTNALLINRSANVGIGTNSPTERLHLVNSTNGFVGLRLEGTSTYAGSDWTIYASSTSPSSANDFIGFFNNSTTDGATADYKLRIFKNGDVGIGTTGGINVASGWTNLTANGSTTGIIGVQIAGTNFGAMYGNLANNNFVLQAYGTSNTGNMVFLTASTERMRITSGGAIQMSNNSTTFSIGSIAGVQRIQYGTGGFTTEFAFLQTNDGYTPIGASAFNTRSDYRLKEDLKEFDGLSLVANMKVYDFKWKEKDERNYGFMAHELQEVVPYVVTGTKDGMFEDEPQMQGLDYGKIVPVLVKAIQELNQKVNDQQQTINSLINR